MADADPRPGYLYEVTLTQPLRFRARGLDVAERVARLVADAAMLALEDEVGVVEVEDRLYLAARVMDCDGNLRCRAPLHRENCLKAPHW